MEFRTYSQEDLDSYYEDVPEDVICPYCEQRGYRILLGNKILMPGEPRPEDYDSWLQCPTCYEIIPIYAAPKQEEIKNTIETIESPFDNKPIIESLPNRTTKKSKGNKPSKLKRSRNKLRLDDDKEINDLLRIYGDRVNVLK